MVPLVIKANQGIGKMLGYRDILQAFAPVVIDNTWSKLEDITDRMGYLSPENMPVA